MKAHGSGCAVWISSLDASQHLLMLADSVGDTVWARLATLKDSFDDDLGQRLQECTKERVPCRIGDLDGEAHVSVRRWVVSEPNHVV